VSRATDTVEGADAIMAPCGILERNGKSAHGGVTRRGREQWITESSPKRLTPIADRRPTDRDSERRRLGEWRERDYER
jgi:hypothetical protein